MNSQICQTELDRHQLVPRKYYGQVFTTDETAINAFIGAVASLYKPGTVIVEIGGGLGYLTEKLAERFEAVECVEIDPDLFTVLNKKFAHNPHVRLIQGDILTLPMPEKDYLLVGNIPFHISGRLYRRFMSEEKHKPYGMVFITDKQYATTLMGQPPRCYRVSLQAQAYGDIEILSDVPPTAVYPEPKVMCCLMKITHNPTPLPQNFWKVVNYHYENFPTPEVESPKTLGLKDWIELSIRTANPPV